MEKQYKYKGGWTANNNTYNYSYVGNNKRELAKDMREICKGEVFEGNRGTWYVKDAATDEVILDGWVPIRTR